MQLKLIYNSAVYTALEGIRSYILIFLLVFIACIFIMMYFVGELVITEKTAFQNILAATAIRLFVVFTMSIFVITSVVREFNDKSFELILSLPIPRYTYLLGKFAGFCFFSIIVVIITCSILIPFVEFQRLILWEISLMFEVWIMISVCLFFLVTLREITSTLVIVTAFYILSRTIFIIQLIGHSPIVNTDNLSHLFITKILDAIAFILPRLHQFCQSEWLIYNSGSWQDFLTISIQTVVYITLLMSAALFDLYRKNF